MQCRTCSSEVGPFYPLSEGIHICHTCKALGKTPPTDDTETSVQPESEHIDTERPEPSQENTDNSQTEAETVNTNNDQAKAESKPQRKKRPGIENTEKTGV